MKLTMLVPALFLSVLLLLNVSYAATSVVASDASKDGWTSISRASTAGTFTNIGNVNGEVRRGFLYFDTSSIPLGARITGVVLKVYGANYAGSSCRDVGNIKIRKCDFSPLSKDDFNACNNNAASSAILNLKEGTSVKLTVVNIDPSLVIAGSFTQLILKSQNEQCSTGKSGNYARICADGTSTTGCTAEKRPTLEITYSIPVEILSADVSDICPVEIETIDVRCASSVPDVNCISASVGDSECIWNSDSQWEGDVAVFKNCATGSSTGSVCSAGAREVKCYVQTDKCQQTGENKTAAIDVQSNPVVCSVHTDQSQCETDVLCSWVPFCSGAKSSSLSDQCIPKDSDPNYQCNANSCGAECDGSVGCPSNIVGDMCKYSGVCDQENTCTCSYTDQYCPEPGTTNVETDGTTTCYYGANTHRCSSSGCLLSTCTLADNETCSTTNGCVVDACSDGIKNGNETDIDCGGSCEKCADNKLCSVNNDCQSNNCVNNTCTPQNTPPAVSISHSPLNPVAADQVTLTASASDVNGISAIRIFADGSEVKQCTSSPCVHTANFSSGIHTYYAEADDDGVPIATGRDPASGTKSFIVNATCTPQCSGKSCGDSDACGGKCIVQSCGTGQTCNSAGQCESTSCIPKTCAELGRVCGSVNNGCGGTLNCGACATGQACNSVGQCVQQRVSSPTITLKEGESAPIQSSEYSDMTLIINKITIPTQQETYDTCVVQSVELTLVASSPALSENNKLFRYPVSPNSIRKGFTIIEFKRPGVDASGDKFAIFSVSDNCTNVPGFVCGSNGNAYSNACDADKAGVSYTEGVCAGKCYALNNPCAYTNAPTCNLKASIVEVACASAQCRVGPCTVCGNNNQACCSNGQCNVDAGLNCVPYGVTGEKRCMKIPACGSKDEICCRGGLDKRFDCKEGLLCHTGKCKEGIDIIACKKPQTNCGSENQLCCLPSNTCSSGLVCDVGRCKVSGSGTCGDGACNVGENSVNCAADCEPLTTQNTAGKATGFLATLFNIFS